MRRSARRPLPGLVPLRPPGRRKRLAGLVIAALAAAGLAQPVLAAPAPAATSGPVSSPACGVAKKGEFSCFALRRTDVPAARGLQPRDATPAGYGPTDLTSAYNLPANGGAGATIAIVDAYDDPNAEADLALYRQQFGLPACTAAGGCFRKVDQTGGTDYPAASTGWAGEISLDLDMVSAVAPQAHIVLVEANTANFTDLGASVDEAVALGAQYVSNSYGTDYGSTPGSGEDPSETTALDAHYNHPGVAIVASSGDSNYGVSYPAASRYVTSVGGTKLVRDGSTRGWTESVWSSAANGGGSGCSQYEPKPAFQTDTGCAMRSVADVSAVADPNSGVAVYQTYGGTGWTVYGGTSASSPIIAGVYADAGRPSAGSYPNSYPYAAGSGLNDVTAGANGSCSPAYLCTAGAGYDGPTGLGTPNGLSAFRSGPHGTVTGTVSDSSGAPVPDAKVTAGDASAVTGADGGYRLVLPPGTYDVSASAYGYATKTASGVEVTDGGTATEDLTLSTVPTVTVSGKILDGSGKGWPLYAAVAVDGAPGAPVHSDPRTGAYSVRVPQDGTYTLRATPYYPGYTAASDTVSVGSTPVDHDITAVIDPAACATPGYTSHVHGGDQSFDGTAAPPGWTVTTAGPGAGWRFDDPGDLPNDTGGTGNFVMAQPDSSGASDTTLTSPVTDLSAVTDPTISFGTLYQGFISAGEIDLSTDGGTTWTSVWRQTYQTVEGPVSLPVPQAAGHAAVQVRFHYTASSSLSLWQLDDVLIGSTSCDPATGGMVVGTVKDLNTGDALPRTVVSDSAAAATSGIAAAVDDPALDGAFYWLWSPATGGRTFQAAETHYSTAAVRATVTADRVTRADFALKAGRIQASPGSLSSTVSWGGKASTALTLTNTGSAPATVSFAYAQQGFTPQGVSAAQPPLQRVPGPRSLGSALVAAKAATKGGTARPAVPATAVPAGSSWQPVAAFPTPVSDNTVDTVDGVVYSGLGYNGGADTTSYYAYDPAGGGWTQRANAVDTRESAAHGAIAGRIYVVGGWKPDGSLDPTMEVYNPVANRWTRGVSSPTPHAASASVVLDGKLYVIGGCTANVVCDSADASAFDPATGTWTTIADYPEAVAWESCGVLGGRIYCAGGTTNAAPIRHSYRYDPATDTWTRLADLPETVWGAASTAADGRLLMQNGVHDGWITNQGWAYDPVTDNWTALPNSPAASYRVGGTIGFYMIGGATDPFGGALAGASLLAGYDQAEGGRPGWIRPKNDTVTLAPGVSTTVTVTLDAADVSIAQPGTFRTTVLPVTDTPYATAGVPAQLTVAPPRNWGRISGTVQGRDADGAAPHVLPGATVQITADTTTYNLHADAAGHYQLWLPASNSPARLIAAEDGYQPQSEAVKVRKGAVATADFTLSTD